jgi:hypothetical protein
VQYEANQDGLLSTVEVSTILAPASDQPKILRMQLLATYINLATRRINAATAIRSKTAAALAH